MWNQVAHAISDALDCDFHIVKKQAIKQGLNDRLFRISDEQQSFFVKIAASNEFERLESEAHGLELLTTESLFMVPDCITSGISVEFAFSVLEWLEIDHNHAGGWQQAGKLLALMHQKHEQAMFGLEDDNFIGSTPQPNQWHKKWDVFFSEERIGWQLQLLAEKGHEFCNIDPFVDLVKQQLHSHHCLPSLVHGDLWAGNIGFCDGVPCTFDPAIYYGDREVDIAMTRLFNPFPESFYQAYQAQYPLQHGYQERFELYNLYHVLNHANIFAGHYLVQAKEHIHRLRTQYE